MCSSACSRQENAIFLIIFTEPGAPTLAPLCTGLGNNPCTWLRECCRQVEAAGTIFTKPNASIISRSQQAGPHTPPPSLRCLFPILLAASRWVAALLHLFKTSDNLLLNCTDIFDVIEPHGIRNSFILHLQFLRGGRRGGFISLCLHFVVNIL